MHIISTNNCMWIYISTIAKTITFSTQNQRWKYFTSHFLQKHPQIIVEKHRKFAKFVILHNRIQISENFSPIISKSGIFSSTTAIVQQTSINCSHTKLSKQQLTAHTSIVKGYMAKCYKHAPFSSSALL